MTENHRLKIIFEESPYKTQKEFAEKLGIQPGSLSDILRGKEGVGISAALKFKLRQLLRVNLEWLESGTGEPFLTKKITAEEEIGVPFYNVHLSDIKAGNLQVMEEKPDYFVNYLPFNDCTAYLPVYGDSMYPKYASGEIIAVKEVKNLEVLQWGEAYVVITNEEANGLKSIKIIHEHQNAQKLTLKSSNPNFKGDIVINKKDITSLYIIKGKITRHML